ncbi:MAG: AAA family ATPase [Thermoplasmata archaeon]
MAAETGAGHPFVGRGETVEALRMRLDSVRAGTGGFTLLVGDTGVGKSTLVAQLAEEFRSRGIRTLIGRSLALDDPAPFSLIRSAFDSMHDDPLLKSEEAPALGIDQPTVDFTPLLAAAAYPARIGIEQRLLKALDETEERGKKSREKVLMVIADKFLEFTRKGPTVLIVDELHRADESSLAAVEFLVKQLEGQPLWVLGTSRLLGTLSEAGRTRLEMFERMTRAQRVVLRPLVSGEVAGFLRLNDASREFPPEEIARRFAESGGNPLLLQQFDRRIAAGRKVRDQPRGSLPSLDPEALRTLDVAAVLGPEFTFGLLLGASGENEERLTKVVERLVDQGLLFEHPGELLEFPQDRLREEAYSHLTDNRRRLIHRRVGETREAMGSGDLSRVFGLARDFYLGQEDRKSVEYNRVAAEIAEGAAAPDVARDFLTHALESQRDLDPGDREGESGLVLELARVNYELGRLEEAEGILRHFLDPAQNDPRVSPILRATLEIYLARVLAARGELPAVRGLAEKVLATPGIEGQLLLRISALGQLGMVLYYDGRYPEALAQITEEIRLARELGNERVLAHAQMWRAGCFAIMGQMGQALVEAREVAAILERTGSAGESGQGHLFLGNMLADDKSTPQIRQEAIAELGKAIRLGAKAQDPRRVGWAFYHTAEVLLAEERLKEAGENAQQASDTLTRVGDRVGQSVSRKVRAQIAMAQGEYDRAETDLTEAHRLLQGLNSTLNEIDVVLRLAQLSVARGDRANAALHVAELEGLKLRALRPDLAAEFEQVKAKLAT